MPCCAPDWWPLQIAEVQGSGAQVHTHSMVAALCGKQEVKVGGKVEGGRWEMQRQEVGGKVEGGLGRSLIKVSPPHSSLLSKSYLLGNVIRGF